MKSRLSSVALNIFMRIFEVERPRKQGCERACTEYHSPFYKKIAFWFVKLCLRSLGCALYSVLRFDFLLDPRCFLHPQKQNDVVKMIIK